MTSTFTDQLLAPNEGLTPIAAPGPRAQATSVAVIGGSAAGFLTSALLAQKGVAVRLYESSPTLDPAPRTLIVTAAMRRILGDATKRCVVNEIRRFELFTDGRAATITLKEPDLIIERRALIQALAEGAERAGVAVELGSRFHDLHPNGRGLVVEIERDGKREEVRADSIVGGDGVTSRVARSAGWAPLETVPLVQAIVRLPRDMRPDTTRVWFVPDDTPYFYWLIPESPTRGALGIIGESGQKTRRALERFLEKQKLHAIEFQGARIPVYTGWVPVHRRFGQGSVYLVGDAAAQVKVSTVGGTVTGFRGAVGVAQSILRGNESQELRDLRRELDLHLLVRRSLHYFRQSDYSRLVDLLSESAKRPLADHNRDEAWKILWRLCLRKPQILLYGLRGLFTRPSSLIP